MLGRKQRAGGFMPDGSLGPQIRRLRQTAKYGVAQKTRCAQNKDFHDTIRSSVLASGDLLVDVVKQPVAVLDAGVIDQHGAVDTLENKQAARGGPDHAEVANQFLDMRQRTRAAQDCDRHRGCRIDLPRPLKIVTLHLAIILDRVDHDLAGAQLLHFRSHIQHPPSRIDGAVMGPDFVDGTARTRLDVKYDDHALVADRLRGLRNHARIGHSRGTDRHLLDPKPDDGLDLIHGLDAAAVAQRHPRLEGEILEHFVIGTMSLHRRVDVVDGEFVDGLLVKNLDHVDGVADVFRAGESDRLDEAFVLNEKARNDPGAQHDYNSAKFFNSRTP